MRSFFTVIITWLYIEHSENYFRKKTKRTESATQGHQALGSGPSTTNTGSQLPQQFPSLVRGLDPEWSWCRQRQSQPSIMGEGEPKWLQTHQGFLKIIFLHLFVCLCAYKCKSKNNFGELVLSFHCVGPGGSNSDVEPDSTFIHWAVPQHPSHPLPLWKLHSRALRRK